MPPPPLSRSPLGIRLPFEVLEIILSHVKDPLDLYHFSLVNNEWRHASIDSPSWEDAFWRFYRPREGGDEHQRKLATARTMKRAKAMQAWLQGTATSLPTVDAAQPLLDSSSPRAPNTSTALVPLPPFLESMLAVSSKGRLDFHSLFISRASLDQRFLNELVDHARRSCGKLKDAHRLIQAYGDDAREILSALCATQVATGDTVNHLLSLSDSHATDHLRAIDAHTAAAEGRPCPHPALFLTLRFAAKEMLGHLQRREAAMSLQGLQQRCETRGEGTQGTLKEEVARCRVGLQESLEDLALFRGGEKTQLTEYFDLLALFLWAELQAQDRCGSRAYTHPPHYKTAPPRSSRQLGARIVSILRSLGFRSTQQLNQQGLADHFIDVGTLCPDQRVTSPSIFAAIICNVLQRLGIQAVPLHTPWRMFCLAVEETPEPEDWAGKANRSLWDRWFIDASHSGLCIVLEADEVASFLATKGVQTPVPYMSPAAPRSTAQRAAKKLSLACDHMVPYPDCRREDGQHGWLINSNIYSGSTETRDPLVMLRLYLEGRQDAVPKPLLSPTLLSYLAELPPTRHGGPRVGQGFKFREADYAACWSHAILGHGDSRMTEEALCPFLRPASLDGRDSLDILFLLEISSCPSPVLLDVAKQVLAADEVPTDGIGGYGLREDKEGRAAWTEEEKKQRLDRSSSKEVEVIYNVGTVFHHRSDHYTAVIVGWDCEKRAHVRPLVKVDSPPPGPSQPYYHALDEGGQLRYVPQAAVEPVKIVDSEQAGETMRGLVKLLRVRQAGRCFATLRVQPDGGEQGGMAEGGDCGGGGRVVLVMNAWMREAWPFD